ncbi:hypothetical protein [Yoonia sp.]|uniref:hypothetical protein n=1 Tax=Yoonia sp. TaxID=2212373 RepID=UPI0023B60650
MTMMVSIARVSTTENPMGLPEYHAEQEAIFGDAMKITAILRDPNDPHQVAVVGEVKDLEATRAISRTPEGDAMMRKYGFVEQLSYFLEE